MQAMRDLWASVQADPKELNDLQLDIPNTPILPSPFNVGALTTGAVGAVTLAAAKVLEERNASFLPPTSPKTAPLAKADARTSTASFLSERFLRINGQPAGDLWAPVSGDYPTADGTYVRLHGNFPNHTEAALKTLKLPAGATKDDVKAAVLQRTADDIVKNVEANGGCASKLRSLAEWKQHPQYRALSTIPIIETTRLSQSSPLRLLPASRPLKGLRILELTRVLAGPVCGRVLAAHGANVLHVSAAHLPALPAADPDTSVGKRSCYIDLRTSEGKHTLRNLIKDADVFLQSYRPGSLAAKGFGPQDVASINPGIIYASVSAYGRMGPWSRRRGFDSLVQLATGIAHEGGLAAGKPGTPYPLPCQGLDHATGWMAALGIISAIRRRAKEGGAWHVECSLARTGMWLESMGRVENGLSAPGLKETDIEDVLAETESMLGQVRHVKMPGIVRDAKPRWERPPPRMGQHPPVWED